MKIHSIIYSLPSIPPYLWVQPIADGVELYYLLLKKLEYEWTHAIQTPDIQESAVCNIQILGYGKEYVHLHRWEGCWMAFGNRFADSIRSIL